ncbi:MAG TPA: thioether cross-link-forming SCIFF peptide maturase [Thermoanaerobacterales bacterium]|nr:thioether cross-link-forming SCIFF peptide maturase [Thermoanaerobacterales bacterium]
MTGQIHKFRVFDKNIVLDVNSGSVFEIDDLVYDVLDYYGKYSAEDIVSKLNGRYETSEILDALSEIDELKGGQMLYSEADFSSAIKQVQGRKYVKALCLNVAHDCNLRCRYCFAARGDYHGKRELMSKEVGRNAVDFLVGHSGNIENLEIDFFGGEPLMALDTIREVVSYARNIEEKAGKKFHFTVTTNAVLLNDETMNFLHKNMDNIVLSLDGRKEVNDYMRVRVDGSGSYDKIVENIRKMVALRKKDWKDYYVRGTFTSKNLDFAEDVFHLADMGFGEISLEPVVGREGDFLLACGDEEIVYRQYEMIAREYLKRKNSGKNPFRFYHFNVNIYHGPCIYKRLAACGAGREYLAVTPNGDIYPCHQFVGLAEFHMGNVFDKKLSEKIIERFQETHVFSKSECSGCWARFYCSGGCNAVNFQINGDMNKPYDMTCKLQKKRIEIAIYLGMVGNDQDAKQVSTLC